MKRRGRVLGPLLAALLLVAGACQGKIVRLVEQGRYDEAIRKSQERRFRPRGRAARAYAIALRERGQLERARDVLLQDFRRGARMMSLIALADLERDMGRRGIAAVHYARAFDVEPSSLNGRDDVCALFRDRARALLEFGEALAAEEQMARADAACQPLDTAMAHENERLRTAIDEVAEVQVAERIRRTICEEPCKETSLHDRTSALQAELDAATDARSLAHVALARGAKLPPQDVVRIVLDDLRGAVGPYVLTDDQLRVLVGDATWSDYAPRVMSQPAAEAAWVQLRLSTVIDDLPMAPDPRRGPSQRERWAERAAEIGLAQRWRVFAHDGDRAAIELELSSLYRPKPKPKPTTELTEAEGGVDDTMVAPVQTEAGQPAHWSARVELDSQSLPAALMVADLRGAAGQGGLALELRRYLLGKALERPGLDAPRHLATAVTRDIAFGRPFSALALVDVAPADAFGDLRAAAATAIALTRIFCDGPCRDDPDEATVRRVMGDEWVDATLDRLGSLTSARVPNPSSACPSVRDILLPDATGPLPEAIAAWREDPRAPGRGESLAAAAESSISLACSRTTVLVMMADEGHSLAAGRLAEMYAHAPQLSAGIELDAHARMAMVAGERERAELLATAAGAAANDPIDTWLGLARFSHRTGQRSLELKGLQEAILHSPSLQHEGARRAMVEIALHDLQRGWFEAGTEPGRRAIRGHVDDYLGTFPIALRHERLRRLAHQVADSTWIEEETRPELVEALFSSPERRAQMSREVAQLAAEAPQPPRSEFDVAGLAANVSTGAVTEVPALLQIVVEPAEVLPLLRALAARGRDWIPRWRAAVAIAVLGDLRSELDGLLALRELIGEDAARRGALVELTARAPGGLKWGAQGDVRRTWAPKRLLEDPELSFSFALGLDPSPALVAR